MATVSNKIEISKFPLRLMPSVRRTAEAFSEKEGVSLNQFINVAVAEKVAHLQHEEWMRNRRQPTRELAERALGILEKAGTQLPEPGDELPEGYRSTRQKRSGRGFSSQIEPVNPRNTLSAT